MQQTVNHREKFPLRDTQKESNLSLAIQKLFHTAGVDASLASEFEQLLKVYNLELGDDALNCIFPDPPPNNVRQEHNGENFYIVCQGRVRLLGVDAFGQQEVSAVVLEEGETFGADALLCDRALPYRAIASGALQVACLEAAQLARFLERLPALREYLEAETQKRQRQIFFKTSTDLRRLPSHQLREIVPNIVEIRIKAGESLAKATPASGGRYWLGSGELSGGKKGEVVSDLHPSWGYPQETPQDWVAKTELLVYHLGWEDWQVASAIAPKYFSPGGDTAANNGHKSATPRRKSKKGQPTIAPSGAPAQESKDSNTQTAPGKSPNKVVAFPKPVRRLRWPWQGYPFILQQSSSDCGAACLSMISLYWGKRFTISYLRELVNVGVAGASLKNLAAGAESLGFMARPVRASIGKMAEQKNPWIAHWQGIHYVVVYKCKGNRIVVADPAQGKKSISRKEFLQNWSGYALVLDPTPRLQQAESQKISLGRFVGALGSYKSLMAQIILTSLLVQVFSVVTPLFTQIIFDQVVVHKSLPTLNIFILGLLLFNFWNIGLGATRQYLLAFFSNRLNLTLIGGFINHTLMLPLKFFESRRVGDILTRVQENNKIQQFLIGQVVLAWLDMVMGLVYLGLMLYYNLQLTLLVLALIPPIVILTLVATPILQQVSREIFNESAEQNSLLVEMLTGVSTVKAVAAEREVRWRWEDRFTSSLNLGFKGQNLGIGLQVISGSINTLGSTALLWYGATLVIQDQLTIGQFMAFNMMIGRVISPFLALVGMWNQLQEVLISVERLNDVFEAEPEQIPGKPMLILPHLRGEVRFDNVSFRYGSEEERNTLQNISFEAYPGQTIAIVGRSGSGKSTLVKLLQGLYYADSGRVLIDGHDVRHVSPQSLRSQLGVVPQESFLFSGTIMENITLYRPEFTLEQVTEVAKLAEAHGFIQDLPLGYNTKVGERGSNLSGGQRQRLSIARALLGAPPILVLDEATSSLDTESERRFQNNLERLSRDRTTFVIAHRLSTVRNADSILVLDRGILVEQGNHEQLMAQQGLYFHLAQQQLNL